MQLGWIDFSTTERNKVLSILDLLSEKGTLDELGISPIRDGFANIFFPGTSTIQTRAKYFFIIPYAMKELESKDGINIYNFKKELDEYERKCGYKLLENNSREDGVIGKRSLNAGKWVKRAPSDIYWAGLRRYGIFTGGKLSRDEYISAACHQNSSKRTVRSLGSTNDKNDEKEQDDKRPEDIAYNSFWNIPTFNVNWCDSLSMDLAEEEAFFLKQRIIKSCPDSMLGYILSNDQKEFMAFESFDDITSIIHSFPKRIQEDYYLANDFSDFIYVASLIFNCIINEYDIDVVYDSITRSLPELSKINLNAIYSRLYVKDRMLIKFLDDLKEHMRNENIEKMMELIKKREIWLKGEKRAKSAHPGELEPGWYGGPKLDYRFRIAKQIITDIFDGEVNSNA